MKIQEAIQKFKESERPEQIIPMLTDDKLNDLISAWNNIMCRYSVSEMLVDQPTTASDWWILWDHVELDIEHMALMSGISMPDVMQIVKKAIGHQLIYPDGTVNQYAQQYLRSVILDKLPKKK